jgi:hypothetical protein
MEIYEWLSQCCDAKPALEVDESTIPYGGPTGFCSHCYDTCGFYEGEVEEERIFEGRQE